MSTSAIDPRSFLIVCRYATAPVLVMTASTEEAWDFLFFGVTLDIYIYKRRSLTRRSLRQRELDCWGIIHNWDFWDGGLWFGGYYGRHHVN